MIQENAIKERVRIIDAIRGFSLLGILLANMLIFQYGIFGQDKLELFQASQMDLVLSDGLTVFVKGSFMPIFMFLFGYGLYKLRESLIRNGQKPWRSLVRRFIMLMALGIIHSMLLWEGDILMAYGLISFGLLIFMKRKAKTLMIWGIVLLVVMSALSYGNSDGLTDDAAKLADYIQRSIAIYGEGGYLEIQNFRMNEDPMEISGGLAIVLLVLTPLMLAPMFLFGMAATNKGWFEQPLIERRRFRILALILVPQGILYKAFAVWQQDSDFAGIATILGSSVLALGYIFATAYLFTYMTRQSTLIKAFEAVGRMSLTNYLMQTVICTTIFYGYGLGWFSKIGIFNGILLSILIYAIQAVLSAWVLKKFKYGPVERLLRMWTYFSFRANMRVSNPPGDSKHINT